MQDYPTSEPKARSGIRCQSCSYDLIGVVIGDRCPECGTQVMQWASQQQSSGKAITSMVLGILAIITCLGYGILGVPCGIVAIVFAKKARLAVQDGTAPASSLGMATAGRICGWIGLILSALYLLAIIGIIVIAAVGAAAAGAAAGPFLLP
ncbi:MAG: DUF4190 domain-containing protein [Phycisphaerales bacterium]|nr:DUF4190 domain-containing protein [Phycisphaerales bacterium]